MMPLLRAEFLRLASSRAFLISLLAVAGLAAWLAGSFANSVRPLSDAERSEAVTDYNAWVAAGSEAEARLPTACAEDGPCIDASDVTGPQMFERPTFGFSEYVTNIVQQGRLLILFLALGVGAWFVGAEYLSGSLGTQLTFTPRRSRVLWSKAVAAAAAGFALAAVWIASAVTVCVLVFVALRGSDELTSNGSLGPMLLRIVVACVLAAAVGALVTFALGGARRAVVVVLLLAIGSEWLRVTLQNPWELVTLPTVHIQALLNGEYLGYWNPNKELPEEYLVTTFWPSFGFLVALLGVLAVVAVVSFRRQDILK